MGIAASVLSLLLAAVSLGAGVPKVRLKGEIPDTLRQHMGLPERLVRLIGLAEVAAAAGLVVGLFWRPLGVAAAGGLVVVFVGAVACHAKVGDYADATTRGRAAVPIALGLAAVAAVVTLAM